MNKIGVAILAIACGTAMFGCTFQSGSEADLGEDIAADHTESVDKAISALMADNSMQPNDCLFQGQRLNAPNCYYHLDMQTDGNLVAYRQGQVAIWSTRTNGVGFANYAILQSDGNFVVYSAAETPRWNSHTAGAGSSAILRMQDDGNVVVYSGSPLQARWASGTNQLTLAFPCGSVPKTDVTHVFSNLAATGGTTLAPPTPFVYMSQCGNACAANSSCIVFSWKSTNGPLGTCSIFSAATSFGFSSDALSTTGVRVRQ